MKTLNSTNHNSARQHNFCVAQNRLTSGEGSDLKTPQFEATMNNGSHESFLFDDLQGWLKGVQCLKGSDGPCEPDLSIEFYAGGALDRDLADSFKLDQSNIETFLRCLSEWDEELKTLVILQVPDHSVSFVLGETDPTEHHYDVDYSSSIYEFVETRIDEGEFGIPLHWRMYICPERLGADLADQYNLRTDVVGGQDIVFGFFEWEETV